MPLDALAPDPGKPSKPGLMLRALSMELRAGAGHLASYLGFRKLNDTLPADWRIPDSHFAVQAIDAARALSPEFMLRHCFRSYCFGAIVAARHGLKLDREVFFVAAMLHDLGLTDAHADDPGSFEWVGAKLAHTFCLENQQTETIAATVHNAIALHTSIGIAQRYQPEIAMLHFGTAMDLFGKRIDEVPGEALDAVLTAYPRDAFKSEFTPCLSYQAQTKPNSHIACAVEVGVVERIQAQLS